jgi:hypothetical protein
MPERAVVGIKTVGPVDQNTKRKEGKIYLPSGYRMVLTLLGRPTSKYTVDEELKTELWFTGISQETHRAPICKYDDRCNIINIRKYIDATIPGPVVREIPKLPPENYVDVYQWLISLDTDDLRELFRACRYAPFKIAHETLFSNADLSEMITKITLYTDEWEECDVKDFAPPELLLDPDEDGETPVVYEVLCDDTSRMVFVDCNTILHEIWKQLDTAKTPHEFIDIFLCETKGFGSAIVKPLDAWLALNALYQYYSTYVVHKLAWAMQIYQYQYHPTLVVDYSDLLNIPPVHSVGGSIIKPEGALIDMLTSWTEEYKLAQFLTQMRRQNEDKQQKICNPRHKHHKKNNNKRRKWKKKK